MTAALFRPREGAEPIPGYRLEALLGKGGFGEVWRALGPGGFKVALKFLVAEDSASARELESLRLLQNIRDSHLLNIHGVWEIPGFNVLAMELADCTLKDRLKQCREQGRPGVPRGELQLYFQHAAAGLDFLNDPRHPVGPNGRRVSIQHGDVKPANLLIIGSGCKVGDFGLMRCMANSAASQLSGSMTAAYAAPEVFGGRATRQSDQYSLAVTWCELRGGRLPFAGGPLQIMAGHVANPPDLSMLPPSERPAVARALSKDPRDRHPNCRSFVDSLTLGSSSGSLPVIVLPPVSDLNTDRIDGTSPAVEAHRSSGRSSRTATRPVRDRHTGWKEPRRRPAILPWLIVAGLVTSAVVALLLWGPRFAGSPGPVNPRKDQPAPDRPADDGKARDRDARTQTNKDQSDTGPKDDVKPQARALAKPGGASPSPGTVRAAGDTASAAAKPSDPFVGERAFLNALGMRLVPIRPGSFTMGSPPEEERRVPDETPHKVKLTRPFHLASCPVTVAQFRAFVEDTAYHKGSRYLTEAESDRKGGTGLDGTDISLESDPRFLWNHPGWRQSDDYPVVNVSWNDAVAFCKWLSAREKGIRYRLPTEAEWEYACRANTTTPWNCGKEMKDLAGHANLADRSMQRVLVKATMVAPFDDGFVFTSPVGHFKPNPWGLHDMHGNVWQWCGDWYAAYEKDPVTDPAGPRTGEQRVARGGSWGDHPLNARAAIRFRVPPSYRGCDLGFRVVAEPAER
jgi:formylglycine-generating enzyme required for sulfatase activity/serine/threonine protein kinase